MTFPFEIMLIYSQTLSIRCTLWVNSYSIGLQTYENTLRMEEPTRIHPLKLFFNCRRVSMIALLGVSFVDDVAFLLSEVRLTKRTNDKMPTSQLCYLSA